MKRALFFAVMAFFCNRALIRESFAYENHCSQLSRLFLNSPRSMSKELQCVFINYPRIYFEDFDYFWSVLNRSQTEALSCISLETTKDFIYITANMTELGADFNEFISKGVERLCVTQPTCFKAVVNKLDQKTYLRVIERLRHPMYFAASELSVCTLSQGAGLDGLDGPTPANQIIRHH